MKLAAVQLKSVKGNIELNISRHVHAVNLAANENADFIIFPELSVTDYEPSLADQLAMDLYDHRLAPFQLSADQNNICIAIGIPTKDAAGVYISMAIFRPAQERLVYSKKYLHADEYPYFSSGNNFPVIEISNKKIAPAICYELSVPEHTDAAIKAGADIYVASVAKTAAGVDNAARILSLTAEQYQIPVLMCNAIGPADNFINAGCSAAWKRDGSLLAKLGTDTEAILFFDSERETAYSISL